MHLLVELPQYSFRGDQDHQLYYKTLCHLLLQTLRFNQMSHTFLQAPKCQAGSR